MGFSRGLANIATFGAVGRVDKAGRAYQRLVRIYNRLSNDIRTAQEEIKEFLEEEKEWNNFKKKNQRTLKVLYKDKSLSVQEQQALMTLEVPLSDFKGYLKVLNQKDATFADSALDNVAITGATLIMNAIPGLGTLGTLAAHLSADEEIQKFEALSDKVEVEINRIRPIHEQILKQRNTLKLRNEAYHRIKTMVEKYGKN